MAAFPPDSKRFHVGEEGGEEGEGEDWGYGEEQYDTGLSELESSPELEILASLAFLPRQGGEENRVDDLPAALREYPRAVGLGLLDTFGLTPVSFAELSEEAKADVLEHIQGVLRILRVATSESMKGFQLKDFAKVGLTGGQFLALSFESQIFVATKLKELKAKNTSMSKRDLEKFANTIRQVEAVGKKRRDIWNEVSAKDESGTFDIDMYDKLRRTQKNLETPGDHLLKIELPLSNMLHQSDADPGAGLFGYPLRLAAFGAITKSVGKAAEVFEDTYPVVGDKHSYFLTLIPAPDTKEKFVQSLTAAFKSKEVFLALADGHKVFLGGSPDSYQSIDKSAFVEQNCMKTERLEVLWDKLWDLRKNFELFHESARKITQIGLGYIFELAKGWNDFGGDGASVYDGTTINGTLQQSDELMELQSTNLISAYESFIKYWEKECKLAVFVDGNYAFFEYLRTVGYDPSRPIRPGLEGEMYKGMQKGKGKKVKKLTPVFYGPPEKANAVLAPAKVSQTSQERDSIEVKQKEKKITGYGPRNVFSIFDALRNLVERVRAMVMYFEPAKVMIAEYRRSMRYAVKKPVFVYYANVDEMYGKEKSNILYPDLVRDLMYVLATCNNPLICINSIVNQFLEYHTPSSRIISAVSPVQENPEYQRLKKKLEIITKSPVLFVSNSLLAKDRPTDLLDNYYFDSIEDQLVVHSESLHRLIGVYREVGSNPAESIFVWRILSANFQSIGSSHIYKKGGKIDTLVQNPAITKANGNKAYCGGHHTSVYYTGLTEGGSAISRFRLDTRSLIMAYQATCHSMRQTILDETEVVTLDVFSYGRSAALDALLVKGTTTSIVDAITTHCDGGIAKALLQDSAIDAFFVVEKIKRLKVVASNSLPGRTFRKTYESHFHMQGIPMDVRYFLAETALDLGVFWIKYLTEMYKLLGMEVRLTFQEIKKVETSKALGQQIFNDISVYPLKEIPIPTERARYTLLAEIITKDMDNLIQYLVSVPRYDSRVASYLVHQYSVAPALLVDSMIDMITEFHSKLAYVLELGPKDTMSVHCGTLLLLLNCIRLHYFQGLPAHVIYTACGNPYLRDQLEKVYLGDRRRKDAEKVVRKEGTMNPESGQQDVGVAVGSRDFSSFFGIPSSPSPSAEQTVFGGISNKVVDEKDLGLVGTYTLLMKSNPSLHDRLISPKGVLGKSAYKQVCQDIEDGKPDHQIVPHLAPLHRVLFTKVLLMSHSSRTITMVDPIHDEDYNTVQPPRFQYDLRLNRLIIDNRPVEEGSKVPYERRRNSVCIDVKYNSTIPTTFIDTADEPFLLNYDCKSQELSQNDLQVKDFDPDAPFIFGLTYRQLTLRVVMELIMYKYDTLTGDKQFMKAISKSADLEPIADADLQKKFAQLDPHKMAAYYAKSAIAGKVGADILRYIYALTLHKGFYYRGSTIRKSAEVDVGLFLADITRLSKPVKVSLHLYLQVKKARDLQKRQQAIAHTETDKQGKEEGKEGDGR